MIDEPERSLLLMVGALVFGLFVLGGVELLHDTNRHNYCAQACSDARTCQFFPLPDNCESSCARGHRTIELPRTCEQLKHNVDETGYLW